MKSFAQARNYTWINEPALNESAFWLIDQQQKDGCFEPVGKVLHKGMKVLIISIAY